MLKLLIYFLITSRCTVLSERAEELLSKFHQSDYKVNFGRAQLVSYDKTIYKRYEVKHFKYNRTQIAFNYTFEFNVDIGYDLQSLAQIYKFYSNEYRSFPVRMQAKVCSILEANVAGFATMFLKDNPGCPFKKNQVYHMGNFFPDESLFPPLMPTGDFMLEMTTLFKDKEIGLFRGYATVYRPIVIKD